MVRLRPFKERDMDSMLPWLQDERTFAMWCAGIFSYPLTREQMSEYISRSELSDCEWSMAATDEQGVLIGHFHVWLDCEKNSAHLGMIVVDDGRRGQGLGRQMVSQAVRYAFEILGVQRVTLGVFDCNPRAHACYQRVGFRDGVLEERAYEFHGEFWNRQCMEFERPK